MFRTANNRGLRRFKEIRKLDVAKKGSLTLTAQQVASIESSNVITLMEKIELLLVALGNKLTTELYQKIRYISVEKNNEKPSMEDINEIEKLLASLPYVFFKDCLEKTNKQTGRPQQFTWFQVSLNQAVNHFMLDYPDDLTEFEEGVLYGYPLSAIRAFSGLIESNQELQSTAQYYLAGVGSVEFFKDEKDYYEELWARLTRLSPKIIREAEDKYKARKSIK